MEIKRISCENARKKIYHIYGLRETPLEITEDTLVHFRLQKGQQLNAAQVQEIEDYDQVMRCTRQAVRFLERRAHLRRELALKLTRKGFSPEVIDQTLDYLNQKQLLDDREYISAYVHDAITIKRYGRRSIKARLLQKGADVELVEKLLNTLYTPEKEMENALFLWQKNKKRWLPFNSARQMQKMVSFFQNRGFDWEIIQQIRLLAEEAQDQGEEQA